jgi:hypothetical protein
MEMPVRRFGLVTPGTQSSATVAYFDGFIDGYQSVDPHLSHVDELWRERPDGKTEFVVRFWYRARADQGSSEGIRAAAQGKEVEGCRYS